MVSVVGAELCRQYEEGVWWMAARRTEKGLRRFAQPAPVDLIVGTVEVPCGSLRHVPDHEVLESLNTAH